MSKGAAYLSSMIFWIPPKRVKFCTPSSKYADLNQHDKDPDHPHAFYDRGYFYENIRKGDILPGGWDDATLKFSDLLEYKALYRHINGIEKWRDSVFANRMKMYMLNTSKESIGAQYRFKGFENPSEFAIAREAQINVLIQSIKDYGVQPSGGKDCYISELDDISVNLSHTGEVIFNNRGHHRLAIAKILNIELVPVQLIVWHSNNFTW
jgi:hypothetical protein